MEGFLNEILSEYQDIGLSQDNLIKLIFLLQDNHNKEMADIEAQDADFAIKNKEKILAVLFSVRKFLQNAKLYDYYKEGGRSFIPLFFVSYHLFHQNKSVEQVRSYFDNYDTGNQDFLLIKKWIYHSLLNGVFRSRGAGWVSYKTGVRKLLEEIKKHKDKLFPKEELFNVYIQHPISFQQSYDVDRLDDLDSTFVFYLIYNCKTANRVNDIDHIMPKSILQNYNYAWDKINGVANYQLLDYSTNRGNKNASSFADWLCNEDNVKDKKAYLKMHLIPENETLWREDNFEDFIKERSELIINKINSHF